MSRYLMAISVLLAVACHAAFGAGARTLCVAAADSACAIEETDACCTDPVSERCPPTQDGDECCFDVLPITLIDSAIARRVSTNDGEIAVSPAIPSALLAIPPPPEGASTKFFRRIPGPPNEVREIVRTSRLLL